MNEVQTLVQQARKAFHQLARAEAETRKQVVERLADLVEEQQEAILAANQADIDQAQENKLSEALVDRLRLTPARLEAIAQDLRQVANLEDPVGEVIESRTLPNGLQSKRIRVPMGVVLIIYESRPNVTLDAAALCLKSGNCAILRGGKETTNSNRALTALIQQALQDCGLPTDAVQSVTNPDRALVMELLQQDRYIDIVIPRGGAGLHEFCRQNSRIPVITGGIGICHLYAAPSADVTKAVKVIENAKVQRPSVCNALDTVLVHRSLAPRLLPEIVRVLSGDGVSFRADPDSMGLLPSSAAVSAAGPEDFDTEWLSLVLGLRIVDDIDEAMAHIRDHGTGHSDGILTEDSAEAQRFVREVDSSAVYVNASTRFTDGAQLGLGAEMAVSTQRLHARGPMGLRELTTYKWVVEGDYHTRA